MSIYAISDLHLSFGENKPMDIFGANWENHYEKIKKNWLKKVTDNDLVLLPGDFSWATYLEDTYKDFEFLNSLPGKKILMKGNHDYWWTTLKKMREYLQTNNFKNIDFLQNNSYLYENKIICGTRGWIDSKEAEDKKIIKRENLRLKLSIEQGIKEYGENKEIIVCMHYPPFNSFEEISMNFVKTMEHYNVKTCIYGHLHGESANLEVKKVSIDGINYKLVSSDYLKFNLVKL